MSTKSERDTTSLKQWMSVDDHKDEKLKKVALTILENVENYMRRFQYTHQTPDPYDDNEFWDDADRDEHRRKVQGSVYRDDTKKMKSQHDKQEKQCAKWIECGWNLLWHKYRILKQTMLSLSTNELEQCIRVSGLPAYWFVEDDPTTNCNTEM